MIILYDKNKTGGFNRNDLVLRNVTKCEATWEKNGQFQINLIYPIVKGDTTWQEIVKGAIVKCPVAYQQDQLFRLNTPSKKMDENSGYFYIEVTGYHITYDLNDNFLEDVRPTSKSGIEAGQYILANTQYSHPFTWIGDITDVNTAYYIRKNPINALIGDDDNSYFSRWGGELVRDNFNIGMFKQAGQNRGVVIRYSKNLTGFEQSGDDSNLMTRCLPYCTIDTSSTDTTTTTDTDEDLKPVLKLPEKYIDSQLINKYSHPYVKAVQVELTEEQQKYTNEQKYQIMRDYVNNLYNSNHVDVPVYSYSVNFIDLANTEEYKDYAVLEEVHPYDYVTVKALDIDVIAELVGYTYDSITKQYETITLGNVQNDIIRHNQKSLFQISKQNEQNIRILQAQMQNVPNSMLDIANSTTSGGNNLFDHSVLEDKYITEWVNNGASVIEDDTLHDTDKVWEIPHSASVTKEDIILNPDSYKGQTLTFSLSARYNGLNITYDSSLGATSAAKLGSISIKYKKCLADSIGGKWRTNGTVGIITDYIPIDGGKAFTVSNAEGYTYKLLAYDNDYNFAQDFTNSTVTPNYQFMKVQIDNANMYPEQITGFSIYETAEREFQDVAYLYADSVSSAWKICSATFTLATANNSDEITHVNFTASNGDSSGTVYIGAFMLNTGTVRSDYSQSSNDTVQTLRAHQIYADYIEAKQADIDKLHATNATIDNLSSTYATITNLSVTNGNIDNLKASVGNIMDLTTNTLKSHIITADNIVTGAITAGSGIIANDAIGSAEISEVDAGLIHSGKLDTALVTIISGDNHLNMTGSKIQFFDTDSNNKLFERICIGDINGDKSDYGMIVRAKDGTTTLFDVNGITKEGFTDGYGKLDDSSLDPKKIDIEKTVTAINGATTKINGSSITVDNETLSAKFSTISNTIQGNTTSINSTLSKLTDTANAIGWNLDSQNWTQTGNLTTFKDLQVFLQANKDHISSTVTETDVQNAVGNIQVGGTNLLQNGHGNLGTSNWTGNIATATDTTYGTVFSLSNSTTNECYMKSTDIQVLPNTTYTISCIAGIGANATSLDMFFLGRKSSTASGNFDYIHVGISQAKNTNYQKFTYTFTTANDETYGYVRFDNNGSVAAGTNSIVWIGLIKLEQGNKATDWSPALMDAQSQISGITLTNMVGMAGDSSLVVKTAATGWGNAGCSSVETFNNGQYVEFTISSSDVLAGLSHIDTDQNYTTVQYAFHPSGDGNLYVYENGNWKIKTHTWSIGDILRIAIENNKVNYYHNGELYYTSTVAPTLPLIFDGSWYDQGNSTKDIKKGSMLSGLSTRIATAESNISQQADLIGTKVSSINYNGNTLVSMINQSSSKISMSALNINLSGYVTFNNLATAGQTTIDGGNIKADTVTASRLTTSNSPVYGTIGSWNDSGQNVNGLKLNYSDNTTFFRVARESLNYNSGAENYTVLQGNSDGLVITPSSTNDLVNLNTTAFLRLDSAGMSLNTTRGGLFVTSSGIILNQFGDNMNTSFQVNSNSMDLYFSDKYSHTWHYQLRASTSIDTNGTEQHIMSSYQIDQMVLSNDRNYVNMHDASTGNNYGANIWLSDISLKTNISDSTEDALMKICAIPVRQWTWKDGLRHQKLGIVSQEARKIDESFAFGVKQDDGSIRYQPDATILIPYLIKSVQQEDSKVEQLKSKIISLENRISMLEQKTAQ